MGNPKKTKLVLTVDTECSAGGWPQKKSAEPLGYDRMMFCKMGAKEYGVRHIMNIAEQYSLVVDFFIEPLCSYKLGVAPLKDICQEIIGRGHNVSLHLHPRWKLALSPKLSRLSDSMYEYGVDGQEKLLREGIDILSECGVPKIHAFRAGNLHGDVATYEAMRRVGIPISSNFCGAWDDDVTTRFGLPRALNDVTLINGILEIPVTSFHDFPRLRPKHLRPLQIAAASYPEHVQVIESAIAKQLSFVVILLHTFEWLQLKPDGTHKLVPHIEHRFRKLCEFVGNNREKIETCTFGAVDPVALCANSAQTPSAAEIALSSTDVAGCMRGLRHAFGKLLKYMNK